MRHCHTGTTAYNRPIKGTCCTDLLCRGNQFYLLPLGTVVTYFPGSICSTYCHNFLHGSRVFHVSMISRRCYYKDAFIIRLFYSDFQCFRILCCSKADTDNVHIFFHCPVNSLHNAAYRCCFVIIQHSGRIQFNIRIYPGYSLFIILCRKHTGNTGAMSTGIPKQWKYFFLTG